MVKNSTDTCTKSTSGPADRQPVFIAQREVGEIPSQSRKNHDKQAAETGGNGGLVVRADKLDGVAGRRDDRALHKGGVVVRSVLVGPKIAIAHGVFKKSSGWFSALLCLYWTFKVSSSAWVNTEPTLSVRPLAVMCAKLRVAVVTRYWRCSLVLSLS